MRSIDTNVLVRVLAQDHAVQTAVALQQMRDGAMILPTVVQEATWVLAKRYSWSVHAIIDGMRTLFLLPNIVVVGRPAVEWALNRYEGGADFADMLHLALSEGADAFVTFDKDIARHAGADSPVPVETLVA